MAIKTLFKTIDELFDYITVDISSDFRTIAPYIKQAEKYISDVIGTSLLTSLITLVDEEGTDESLLLLLEKARLPLANFGYMLAISKLNVNVGDAGFTVTVSNNLEPASKWRIDDFRESVESSGNDALEVLIAFLEENKDTYTDWEDSIAYSYQKKFFINNATEFNDSVFLNISRLNFLELKPFIHQIEKSVIQPAICQTLFDEIKLQIVDDDLSDENKQLLNTFIRPAVCYLAMDKHTNNENYKLEGMRYAEQLQNHLNDNASDYPLYQASDCYEDPITAVELNSEESGLYIFG